MDDKNQCSSKLLGKRKSMETQEHDEQPGGEPPATHVCRDDQGEQEHDEQPGEQPAKRVCHHDPDEQQDKSKDEQDEQKDKTKDKSKDEQKDERKDERKDEHKADVARGGPRVDIFYIQPWQGWTEIEPCELCGTGDKLQHTFEASWRLWPDGPSQYCSSMCFKHALKLVEREPDWKFAKMSKRNKQVYGSYGLLRREDWSESMRICNEIALGE